MRNNNRAFTLIELLVVIAIIAILAGILFPVFASAREKSRQTKCLNNCKQLMLGVTQYMSDYNDYFPLAGNAQNDQVASAQPASSEWQNSIMPYVKNDQIFGCPSSPDFDPKSHDKMTNNFRPVTYLFTRHATVTSSATGVNMRISLKSSDVERPVDFITFLEGVGPTATNLTRPIGKAWNGMVDNTTKWNWCTYNFYDNTYWLFDGAGVSKKLPYHKNGMSIAFLDGHADFVALVDKTGSNRMTDLTNALEAKLPFGKHARPMLEPGSTWRNWGSSFP